MFNIFSNQKIINQTPTGFHFTSTRMAVIKKADKLDMVACAFNPKNMEEETGAPGVKGHPQLHIEFKANLGYMKL